MGGHQATARFDVGTERGDLPVIEAGGALHLVASGLALPQAYNTFVPAAAFYGIRQGKIVGVPTGGPDSEATMINTQLLREVGLDPSYDKLKSWTWEDFDAAADRLTVRNGTEVQRAGYRMKVPDGRHLAVWMYSQGGSLYNKDYTGLAVNNEQGVRAPDHLLMLFNGKRVSAGLGGALLDLFYQGRAAMVQVNASDMQPKRLRAPQWKAVLKDLPQLQRAFDVATVGGEPRGCASTRWRRR